MSDTGQIAAIVGKADRRVERTLRALLQAFVGLVVERPYRTITIAEIAERADVGRSTFYEHFGGKDEILLKSMDWMFAILGDAASAEPDRARLEGLVRHYWDNRKLARIVLAPPIEPKLRRALAAALEARLVGLEPLSRRIAAVRIAAGQLGLLEAWIKGEVAAEPARIAEALIAASIP